MKKIISIIIVFAMLASTLVSAAETEIISEGEVNEIFVLYKDGSNEVITFENEEDMEIGIEALLEDEGVSVVSPNYSYEAASIQLSDEYIGEQWALSNDGSFKMEEKKNEHPVFDTPFGDAKQPGQWKRPDGFGRPGGFGKLSTIGFSQSAEVVSGIDINMSEALKVYSDSGKKVIVAIVDTGIDYTHDDLRGRIWTNEDEVAENSIDDDGNGYVDDVNGWNFYDNSNKVYKGSEDDHGTHGAGTVAAISNNEKGIAGITQSDNIKVMSVKALGGRDGSGSTASIIRAIQYAEANGAEICNLSLGTANNDRALYEVMKNSNMLFVVASGNDGRNTDASPSYPASYDLPNIISVANLNYDGNLHYSSNYGKKTVDIAAPGSYILSTTSNGDYSYMSGTSMSAPMVLAAAALVYSHFGDSIALSDVKEILLSSAKKLDSLSGTSTTEGMLDLGAALAFDISELSGEKWEKKAPTPYKGTAPKISVSLVRNKNEQYLGISVYDEDGDVKELKYTTGKQDAEYFKNAGTVLTLNEKNVATLKPGVGILTFWATDEMGNETVYAVEVTEERGYQRGGNHRGWQNAPRFPQVIMPEDIESAFWEIVNEFSSEFNDFFGRW
ncbi:MAG: S8 family serine peptidase [Oscillospiraceae bacterium]|nr:S8 family serine peptidase [Oscillospiraceae bacterium]